LVIDPDKLVAGNNDGGAGGGGSGDEGGASLPEGGGNPNGGDGQAGCVGPTCEICDDGKDNDGNTKIDCDDSACTANFGCVDPPPDGWSYVAINLASRASPCPPGFAASTDVVLLTDEKAMACKCDCGNPCQGNLTLALGSTASCTNGTQSFMGNTNGVCVSQQFDALSFAHLITPNPSCSKTDTVVTKTPTTNGRICLQSSPAAGGCTAKAGQQC